MRSLSNPQDTWYQVNATTEGSECEEWQLMGHLYKHLYALHQIIEEEYGELRPQLPTCDTRILETIIFSIENAEVVIDTTFPNNLIESPTLMKVSNC